MKNELIDKIRNDVIGQRCAIRTPFGSKPLVYADYTASGRSLGFIEDFIRQQVLPYYANTHTETTYTGARTTAWRESARAAVRRAVNAGTDDKVVFCGSGATAAINKLIDVLGLRSRHGADMPSGTRPVVFIGPYEHHSNELPWRESIAQVEVIPLDDRGNIDLAALEQALLRHQGNPQLIGSFSAASNVTGIKSDVPAVTALLRRHGALACWDYAAAGPYVRIDMNGAVPLDAVFLSPHKFVGGPGTPGILIAKQQLFQNKVPVMVGGGTVSYVTPVDHVYISDIERREEGGTPAILESIRAGLVFSLQQQVGIDEIEEREGKMAVRAMVRLSACQNIEVLGSADAPRLPIFALRFHHGDKELHYGFVVSVLNDLFGIQVRGGCSCAGPYAHSLLDMAMDYSRQIEAAVTAGVGIMRPGWVRLNFNYFIDDEEYEYLMSALELVAQYGWRLLPYYHYDQTSGVWRFADTGAVRQDLINNIDWLNISGAADADAVGVNADAEPASWSLAAELKNAEQALHAVIACDDVSRLSAELTLSDEHEALRWFLISPTDRQINCN